MNHNNYQNWYLLLAGLASGLLGFWQMKTGEVYAKRFGSWGRKIRRDTDPKVFWITIVLLLGLSVISIGLAVTHWQ
jgi:hypothetical protein